MAYDTNIDKIIQIPPMVSTDFLLYGFSFFLSTHGQGGLNTQGTQQSL